MRRRYREWRKHRRAWSSNGLRADRNILARQAFRLSPRNPPSLFMAKPTFALLLLLHCGPVCAQHYFPTNWPFSDLQKLEKPCVFAWRTEENKRHKPVGD